MLPARSDHLRSLALPAGADEEAGRPAQWRAVQGLELPPALTQVRAKLKQHADGDRQFVKVLGAVLDHGLAAVESACAEALEAGIASGDVILTVLARRRQDNATALVLDVVDLPPADQDELMHAIAGLPILDLPPSGATVDGFLLGEILSDGRYSRMFRASDTLQGRAVVLKFPHPRVASEGSYRLAFVREAWVATRVRSLLIGEITASWRKHTKRWADIRSD